MSDTLDGRLFGSDQPCFGCGPQHPFGFHLRFEQQQDEIVTRFVPGENHQGPPGIMHGGLVTTLADEVAAWTVVGLLGKFGFTGSMQCRLIEPVRIGTEVEGRGRIDKDGTRVVAVSVRILQSGNEAYRGSFRFALLDEQGAERLLGGPVPEVWKRFGR